ncbi:MAG: hypothetical protein EOO01_16630, partial [Chitinophagaceae bacterium]
MTRLISVTGCIFFLCFFQVLNGYAQAYIEYSIQDSVGPAGGDMIRAVNGEAYVVRSSYDFNPTAKIEKHSADGSILYSTPIPLEQGLGVRAMDVINDEVYLLAGKPAGTFCCGFGLQAIKFSADGALVFNRVISDTASRNLFNPDSEIFPQITIIGNEWIISAWVSGLNFPTTMGGLIVNDY